MVGQPENPEAPQVRPGVRHFSHCTLRSARLAWVKQSRLPALDNAVIKAGLQALPTVFF